MKHVDSIQVTLFSLLPLRSNPSTVSLSSQVQSLDRFCLVDSTGLNIYSYEGRLLTTIRYSGMRVELLNEKTVSLARDLIAISDQGSGSGNTIRIFDVHSGKNLLELEHKRDILKASLNQAASKVAILDKNKDL